jgi:hypothetical protein
MKKPAARKSMKIRRNPERAQRTADLVISGRGARRYLTVRVWADGQLVGSNSGALESMWPGFNMRRVKQLNEAAQSAVFDLDLDSGDTVRLYAADTPESRRRMVRSWSVGGDREVIGSVLPPGFEGAARPNPGAGPGTFRFGREPFGVFNHGDAMVRGDLHAYVDVFDAKRRPIGGGIAITAIPQGGKRGPVWVFAVPDGRDAPYLDGQAHTKRGRVWASARWANADHSALIVGNPR